ncbi:MAG: hypothetical protein AAF809_00410 [Bacteroidota bacterium]
MDSPLIISSEKTLQALIHAAVQSSISEALPSLIREATRKEWLTKKELMELTGWSARQVEYKKSKRQIPFIRRGRTVLFPTDEVRAYFHEGYVPTGGDSTSR